jgi:WD40 repeat protein
MSPSDRYLATGGDDQTVKVWDIYTKACIHTFCGHTSQVLCIRFTTDGSRLISSSADRTIKIWDVNTGDCLATLPGHQNWVWSFNLSPDAQMLLSGSQDETIKCWNLSTEQCWLTLRVARPYEGMKIAGARGLTEAEIATLKALGAL